MSLRTASNAWLRPWRWISSQIALSGLSEGVVKVFEVLCRSIFVARLVRAFNRLIDQRRSAKDGHVKQADHVRQSILDYVSSRANQ